MNRLIHYGAVLLVIAAVAAGLLSSINTITAPQIEKINREIVNKARKQVLPLASEFKESEEVKSEGETFIPGYDAEGNLVGYASTVKTNGYSGVITFVLGLDKNGTITGLKVTGQSETPGLGTNVENPDWQALWVGRDESYEFNKSVDGFAGATISPMAVFTGVKKSTKAFEAEVKN